jgi:hypothetical protein
MKRIVITAALVVAGSLAAAPTASAKGYVRAIQVCGPSGCAPVDGPRTAMQRLGMDVLARTGPRAQSPPLLPYYRLRFLPRYELPDSDTFYIPGAKVICTDGGCIRVRRGLVPALAAAAASVGSFTPRISSVTVGDRPRADRAGFAIMFNQKPAPLPSIAVWQSHHYSVTVEFRQVTPWSLGGASWMAYYPRYHALSRDGRWFHAGADVDRLVRGRAALAEAGAGHGWPLAAAVALVAIAAAAAARRRLRRPEAA